MITKKHWFIFGIILITFFFSSISKMVYFSETEVLIKDTDDNPIENANIRVWYWCTSFIANFNGDHGGIQFGYREWLTDNQGRIKFNSLKSGFHFIFWSCGKYIRAFKTGYCGAKYHPSICNGVDYIWHFDSYYIQGDTSIPWRQKESTMVLKKLEDYSAIIQSLSQRKSYTITSTMCDQISNKFERESCYRQLAIQENDISLCLDIVDDLKYDYCKSDVIKKIGDISKCALINDKKTRSLCEVYCS